VQPLVQEGPLRAKPHCGVIVMEPGIEDVADIYLARDAIERAAAITLLQRNPAKVLVRLAEIVDEMKAVVGTGDWRAVVEADLSSTRCS
jgi:DNA-binding GntR family transcriptional regulator